MSIYATWLSLDGDDHEPECTQMVHDGDSCYHLDTTKPCTCPAKNEQPIIYQGSHVSPSQDDARGGFLMVCGIPDHCHPDVRDAAMAIWNDPDCTRTWGRDKTELNDVGHARMATVETHGKPVEFLRLSMRQDPRTYRHRDEAGDATVVLDRQLVVELRDTLSGWLEAKARA